MSKTYFLAPSRDFPPSGDIALGNVIKSPRAPEIRLNDPNSDVLRELVRSAVSTEEHSARRDTQKQTSLAAKVWTSFTAFAGIGGDVGAHSSKDSSTYHQFSSLVSWTINPDITALRAIFDEPGLQASIRNSRFSANLFMITGVQIAQGTDYVITDCRKRGQHLHLSADLTAATGVPLELGGGSEASIESIQSAAGHIEGAFVYAFRLREILYKRKVVTEQKVYRKGDLYGNRPVEEEPTVPQEFEAEFECLKAEDQALPEVWDLETVADGEGADYQVVLVDGEDDEDD